jgi:hypothetical protein
MERIGGKGRPPPPHAGVEAVEKVPKQILGRDGEKTDLTECATINDLMLGRGQVTPEKWFLLVKRTFPTGSLGPQDSNRDSRRPNTDERMDS